MSMTEKEAIEWLDKDTSPMKIHIAEMKKENPMDYINSAIRIAIEAIVAAKRYREIGTVEECRTAVERMKPKKATDVRYFGEAGYYIGLCPCCNGGNNSEYQYCGDCGQAMDWGKENG